MTLADDPEPTDPADLAAELARIRQSDRRWRLLFFAVVGAALLALVIEVSWSTYWTLRWYKTQFYYQQQLQSQVVNWINANAAKVNALPAAPAPTAPSKKE
jgi:hypothetical protein